MGVPRKKRERYRYRAGQIAKSLGINLDRNDWPSIWAILGEHADPDFLYAIVDEKQKLVKFGKSKNPGQRLKAIKTGNAAELKLWGFCREASPLTEREVHALLKDKKVNREWFSLCDESRAVISRIRDAG